MASGARRRRLERARSLGSATNFVDGVGGSALGGLAPAAGQERGIGDRRARGVATEQPQDDGAGAPRQPVLGRSKGGALVMGPHRSFDGSLRGP